MLQTSIYESSTELLPLRSSILPVLKLKFQLSRTKQNTFHFSLSNNTYKTSNITKTRQTSQRKRRHVSYKLWDTTYFKNSNGNNDIHAFLSGL